MLKNKRGQSAPPKARPPKQQGLKFIQAARAFEQSEIEQIKRSRRTAWRITAAAVAMTVLSVAAVAGLTPLKSVEPFVIRVDNNTGMTDVVSVLKTRETSYGEVIDKYWLAQYIRYRESYDWQTIQATYDATNLLSDAPVAAEFSRIFGGEAAPHKVLRDNYKIVAKIKAIAFIGDMAQVRFEKTTIPMNGDTAQKIAPQNLIATLAYEYRNAPQAEQDRLVNPLGFQVLSYRVDPETPTR